MIFLTKSAVLCYNTHRKCGRPLPGVRRPGAPTGGPSAPAHLPRSRAFQARASWKAGAGSWNVVASWKLALERGCSWKLKLRRRSWKDFASCELRDRRCSWTDGAAGSSKLDGWREGAAGAKGETAPVPFYKRGSWKLREASWDERAEPKVQLEARGSSEA